MEFARYSYTGSPPRWGVVVDGTIYSLATESPGSLALYEFTNPSYQSYLQRRIRAGNLPALDSTDVSYLAPVPNPGKLIGVGLNYHDHAAEQNADIPEQPLLFGKAPSCVINPGDAIVKPPTVDQLDYEVELAVVIGRRAAGVGVEEAIEYVAGFTVLNDVSARDAQFADRQWFRGKSYDTFGPMGPVLVTPDGIDPHEVDVSLRVNGTTKQSSNTRQLIFDVPELIEFISHVMTLYPGDVIATGTPGGVGVFRDPPELLEPGDTVTAEIDGIGKLENPVIASD